MKLILTLRIALLIGLMLVRSTALAADIAGVNISVDGANQTQLAIQVNTDKPPKVFTLDGGKPRIVIDLTAQFSPEVLAQAKGKGYFSGVGGISKLRFARRNGTRRGDNGFRFVADLNSGAKYLSHSYNNNILNVIISGGSHVQPAIRFTKDGIPIPRLKTGVVKPVTVKSVVIANDGIPVPRLKAAYLVRLQAKRIKKPVIVIDPGHGGHDPGAVGAAKTHEETVTLKAALELKKQLLASGKYKVVLTRSTDVYIAHDKRIWIARKAVADLFISIHADSTSNSTTRGASVYTLAARAEARTHKVVSHQNWVLDVDLTRKSAPVSNILVDLAQRKTLTKSGQFADILIPELRRKTKMVGNSHRRAGYYVLLAPDVPAVLLEMGFLSNAKDEKLLNSKAHRKKLMKSVVTAIDKYFNAQTRLQRGG